MRYADITGMEFYFQPFSSDFGMSSVKIFKNNLEKPSDKEPVLIPIFWAWSDLKPTQHHTDHDETGGLNRAVPSLLKRGGRTLIYWGQLTLRLLYIARAAEIFWLNGRQFHNFWATEMANPNFWGSIQFSDHWWPKKGGGGRPPPLRTGLSM